MSNPKNKKINMLIMLYSNEKVIFHKNKRPCENNPTIIFLFFIFSLHSHLLPSPTSSTCTKQAPQFHYKSLSLSLSSCFLSTLFLELMIDVIPKGYLNQREKLPFFASNQSTV